MIFSRVLQFLILAPMPPSNRDLARGQEWESVQLDWTRLYFNLLFSPTCSERHYADFPVAVKTPGICVNCSLIKEIILFGIISELFSRITWFLSLFYLVYL